MVSPKVEDCLLVLPSLLCRKEKEQSLTYLMERSFDEKSRGNIQKGPDRLLLGQFHPFTLVKNFPFQTSFEAFNGERLVGAKTFVH